jgi:hypothetical protein
MAFIVVAAAAAQADDVRPPDIDIPPPAPAAAPAPEPAPEPAAAPFRPTVYIGGGVGVADQDMTDLGWGLWTLTRPFRYAGFQLEYFNLNSDRRNNGDYDGLYIGLMPILPVTDNLGLFGQVGFGFSNRDDDVAGGGGLLYKLPFEAIDRVVNGGITLRADYKYFDFDEEAHLVLFGFMFGFSK